ncbi:MAG: rod-binding protein [Rhodospirillales bacterium]|nr:rod-binding protein [Rhodospirillales bacterium]
MPSASALQATTAAAAGAGRLPAFGGARDRAALESTAREFEAVFLGQMLQPMFAGVGAEEPFGGGMAEDMWQTMLADEYGKAVSKSGGIGIADAVVREILRTQEIEQGERP